MPRSGRCIVLGGPRRKVVTSPPTTHRPPDRKAQPTHKTEVRTMNAPTTTLDSIGRSGGVGRPAKQGSLGSEELRRMDAYWRAANYLSVGQIYLYDNPLLRE